MRWRPCIRGSEIGGGECRLHQDDGGEKYIDTIAIEVISVTMSEKAVVKTASKFDRYTCKAETSFDIAE